MTGPFALTAEALREPWRLWTGHFVHYGWDHALANAAALTVPFLLAAPQDRWRLVRASMLIAPLLSLLLLPALEGAAYRGASGLACALWAMAGLELFEHRRSRSTGLLLLGGLFLKLLLEAAWGASFLIHAGNWQSLPQAHLWGALLGLLAAWPGRSGPGPNELRQG